MATMTKKKKSKSRPAGNKYQLVALRLDDTLRPIVEDLARIEDRKLAQMCVRLIKEALRARGKLSESDPRAS
jgi:hypothetical protein